MRNLPIILWKYIFCHPNRLPLTTFLISISDLCTVNNIPSNANCSIFVDPCSMFLVVVLSVSYFVILCMIFYFEGLVSCFLFLSLVIVSKCFFFFLISLVSLFVLVCICSFVYFNLSQVLCFLKL